MIVESADMTVRGHHAERTEGGIRIETERAINHHTETEVGAAHHTMEPLRIEMLYLMEFLLT
jgi:hypothetical protein